MRPTMIQTPLKRMRENLLQMGRILKNAESFDSLFFQISPREAEAMDPQERIFLETVWKAFEDSGYTIEGLRKQTENMSVYLRE